MRKKRNEPPVLVTGATGYVGNRLIPALLDKGFAVRAMGRSLDKLACRPWARHPDTDLVQGDVLDRESLQKAAAGCGKAFYLVHSMIARKERFAQADRVGAQNMAAAAAAADLRQLIYLGGLAQADESVMSKHLRSRFEVADILAAGSVPVTHLRAPMILGSGSASFEILRYLVEHLPVMLTPRWVRSLSQPIAIRNVIDYLVGCLKHAATIGETFDIGGPEVLTYRDLLEIYAEEAGLFKRLVIPVPVLTPTLSAYWIHLISPVPASIALPLTEGLTSTSICNENRIHDIIPQRLLSCRDAIRLALNKIKQEQVASCWMDAGATREPEWAHCGDAEWAGGTIFNCAYRIHLKASMSEVWRPIEKIGGKTGWYYAQSLWLLRGMLDRMSGGVGLRRGRRHPTEILAGDALDFWRVLIADRPRRLLLSAEMKTPGEALLDFQVRPAGNGHVDLLMISRFLPRGLWGLIYWYGLLPFHRKIFVGMLQAIAEKTGQQIVSGPRRFDPHEPGVCTF
jgi:uncharacterized protein YbjT (DUF2867 family)